MQRVKAGIGSGFVPEWSLQDRMRKARESAGLDQTQIGEQIGVSRVSVSSWECGRIEPKPVILMAWAMATGVDLDWLIGDDGQQFVPQAPLSTIAAANDKRPATRVTSRVDSGVRHQGLEPRTQ